MSRRYQVLYTAFGISLTVYCAFYVLGLAGDGTQLRYWLVPFTLCTVCGIHATAELLARGHSPKLTWGRVDLLWLAPLAFVVLVSYVRPSQVRDALARGSPPLEAAATSQLAAHLAPADAALLGNPEGIYFWSEHPSARVVALTVDQLVRLDAPRLRQLVDTYGIRVALLPAGLPLQQLEAIGFQVIQRGANWVLLSRESGLDQSS